MPAKKYSNGLMEGIMRPVNQNNQDFVYRPLKPLPLEGEDYTFKVDRKGSELDYEVKKQGNEIFVDHFDNTKDMRITVDPDKIYIDRFGNQNDITLHKSDNKIFIDRGGFDNDVTIKKTGDKIEVERSDYRNNVTFTKRGDNMSIDRYGYRDDVSINWRERELFINKYSDADDVLISKDSPLDEVDSNFWHKDFTIAPEGWTVVRKWFNEGLKAEDLVAVTENGEVFILDDYLR